MKILFLLLLSFSCANKNQLSISTEEILINHLLNRFPNEHIFNASEMDIDAKDVFFKINPSGRPGRFCSTFRKQKITDCFVLLASPDSDIKRLVVIENIGSDSPEIIEIPIFLSNKYKNNNLFLSFAKESSIRNVDIEKSETLVQMPNDGVLLSYFEKSTWVIFWDDFKYQKILIAD